MQERVTARMIRVHSTAGERDRGGDSNGLEARK